MRIRRVTPPGSANRFTWPKPRAPPASASRGGTAGPQFGSRSGRREPAGGPSGGNSCFPPIRFSSAGWATWKASTTSRRAASAAAKALSSSSSLLSLKRMSKTMRRAPPRRNTSSMGGYALHFQGHRPSCFSKWRMLFWSIRTRTMSRLAVPGRGKVRRRQSSVALSSPARCPPDQAASPTARPNAKAIIPSAIQGEILATRPKKSTARERAAWAPPIHFGQTFARNRDPPLRPPEVPTLNYSVSADRCQPAANEGCEFRTGRRRGGVRR